MSPVGPNRPLLFSVALAAALVAGVAAALLISQIRPTFLSPAELRDATGLTVLGTVAMNWTEQQKTRQRRARYAFSACLGSLFMLYGGVVAAALLKF